MSRFIPRFLRYLYRVPLLLLHLSLGLPMTLIAIAVPQLATLPVGQTQRLDEWMIRWWQGGLMWIFGLRLRLVGTPLTGPAVFAANHVSWIDISVMHSQRVMGFVAKQEIAHWPLVGKLAAYGRTIFHQRGSTQSFDSVLQAMVKRLGEGWAIGIFPEGHARSGGKIGPFHARIFQAAVEAKVPVQPVALCYGKQGRAQATVAFTEKESFIANFFRLLGEPVCVTHVCFLEPIDIQTLECRRKIAELARTRILNAIESEY